MAKTATYQVVPGSTGSTTGTTTAPVAQQSSGALPLAGIVVPFRRDEKDDFASAESVDLIVSNCRMAVGIQGPSPGRAGELRWRGSMGSLVHQVRHRNIRIQDVDDGLAFVHAEEAIERWEPRAFLKTTQVGVVPRGLSVRMTVGVVVGGLALERDVTVSATGP